MSTQKPNFFVRLWRFFWGAVSWLRIILVNLVFLVFLVFIINTLIDSAPEPIEKPGALFLAPAGILVDQLTYTPPFSAITGNEGPAETLLREQVELIKRAADDKRITGLVIKLNDLQGGGISKINELGQAIEQFKQTGKPVIAYGDLLDQQQYLLASFADEVFIHDMGGVGITGFAMYRNYFKQLIDKLGVNVHVFKSGTFKDFVEPYIRTDMSEPSREHNEAWVGALWQYYSEQIETRRQLEPGALDNYLNQLPGNLAQYNGDSAKLAKDQNLVDHIGSKQQLIDYLSEKFGQGDKKRAFNFIAWQRYQQDMLLANLQKTSNIGLIVASGNILDGEQPEGAIGGETLARIIRKARENTAFKALVIRIDSGGGSAFASELIRQEIAITREAGIPVFISMGSIAASGGYWLATAGTEVWATPSTLTGSIGVFSIVPTFEQTLTKVGVTSDGIDTHTLAGIFHLDRPMSEQAQTVFQMAVDGIYHKFLSITAEARGEDLESIKNHAEGRVWLAPEAQNRNLIDHLGSLDDVIQAAAKAANIDSPSVQLIERELTPLEQLMRNYMQNTSAQWSFESNASTTKRLTQWLESRVDSSLELQSLLEQTGNHQAPSVLAVCPSCEVH